MKKSVYVLGFLTFFFFNTALLFEILSWPHSAIFILTGYILFNFGFLPTLFYKLYKAEKKRLA